MLYTILLCIPFLVSAVTAFTLPGDQADGVYLASLDARGKEVHTLTARDTERRDAAPSLDSFSTELAARDGKLSKRSGYSYCGCGFTLDHGNTDDALADLRGQMGPGGKIIDAGQVVYSVRGSVVVFACNRNGNAGLKIWNYNVQDSASQITNDCGSYIAGSTGGTYSYAIGYMRYTTGLDICGNALTSPSNHC
jgi:hypothetical protein